MRSSLLRWVVLVAALGALALPASAFGVAKIHEHNEGLADFDVRSGAVAPTGAQRAAVKKLRASVTWNQYGTPATLSKRGKYLAKGIRGRNAAFAARRWLERNKALFQLRSTASLVLAGDTRLPFSQAHSVSFKQVFGGLQSTDGLITVGVTGTARKGWKIAFVSSTLTTDTALDGRAKLSAAQGWARAAQATGANYSVAHIRGAKAAGGGWSQLNAPATGALQRVRAVAFPTVRSGVFPAFESVVSKGQDSVYRVVTDARNGAVLLRQDIVNHASDEAQSRKAVEVNNFSGELAATDGACGPDHTFAVGSGVRYLDGFTAATQPLNDVVLLLIKDGTVLISADTSFSPERFHYEPAGGVPPGNYVVRVCDFVDGAGWSAPRTYTGRLIEDDTAPAAPHLARWRAFPSTPLLGVSAGDPFGRPSTDIRETFCWNDAEGCDEAVGNLASRYPWDHNPTTDSPSFTTLGNNAETAESWTHPSAPAPFQFRPVSASRDYSYPWTDSWNTSDCNTGNPSGSAFVPGVSFDISAAVTNLFVAHNWMHDWAYYLGFTETAWNGQRHNFGLTELWRQNDPVIGDAQAGAAIPTPTAFALGARNNANMASGFEGGSAVTNMYLWQPQGGVYYGPCADGDYDLPLIGHEYGHMIENRMIGKGSPRQGHHAGAMGESHGDLFGMEIVNEYGRVPVDGENRYAVSVYATGNKIRGIRNYGMNFPQTGAFPTVGKYVMVNPLNFSDLGFDVTGPSADLEQPGPRQRRDLVGDELPHQVAACGQVRRRLPVRRRRPPGSVRPRRVPAAGVPREPTLDAARVRRDAAGAGQPDHAPGA